MNGIRIVDMSRVLAGPWATMHLADQGADVVKIEPPEGDDTRAFGPHVEGVSTYYLCANRNKRSIALDLRDAPQRGVLYELVRTADVVVQNYRPGVAERLQVDYATLRALKPDLVFVTIHAFGEDGPYAGRPGYDLVLQASGGAMAITGFPGTPPVKCGTSIADLTTGLFCSQAILLGLLHRERTGEGQKIVVNMMQAQANALAYHATRVFASGSEDVQRGNSHGGLAPYDVYRCRDGWIALGCGNDTMFRRLCAAFGIEAKPGWATNAGRVADREALDAVVAGVLAGLAVAEADRVASEAGVPASPVHRPSEAVAHPAVELTSVEHPVLGRVPMVGPALRTATTRESHTAPPGLDADRDAILRALHSAAGPADS
ncbi:MAG: CoA transferase [Alphaproteobacteria bacterium]|nr:CoA transferase [Alphaproteobacteria bacterium]